MMPNPTVLAATVILLLPMGYLLLASPAFLLVRLDIAPVTVLLRGMFNAYFIVLAVAATGGMVAYSFAGRPALSVFAGLILGFAMFARRWFLQQMDGALTSRDAGDIEAVRRLRRLHWGGMLSNAILCGAVVTSIPYLLPY